jgi:hypothetical protein
VRIKFKRKEVKLMKKALFIGLAMAMMIVPTVMLAAPVAANGAIDIAVDIKPGSDPSSLNVLSKGVLPVAVLGAADFDVMAVNASTVILTWPRITLPTGAVADGVIPSRWALEDVNRDGLMDIVLKYSMVAAGPYTVTHEQPGDLIMTLKGNLKREFGGTPIVGEDTVRIINNSRD